MVGVNWPLPRHATEKSGPDGPLVNCVDIELSPHDDEVNTTAKLPEYADKKGAEQISAMVRMADLTRKGFMAGDPSTVMSPRTVITWAENTSIFGDITLAFRLSFKQMRRN